LNGEEDREGEGGEGGYEDSLRLSGDVESDAGRFDLLGECEWREEGEVGLGDVDGDEEGIGGK